MIPTAVIEHIEEYVSQEIYVQVAIIKGKEKIKYYQFNTKAAKHFFCSVCGINTHNLRRSDPNTYGVNVGCLEDMSTKELFELNVRVNDGKNHKMDRIEK